MSEQRTSKELPSWLAIGWGEGSAEMRIVHNAREMVQWLWEQCGPDHTGNEESTRNRWYAYLEEADNWTSMDGLPRWNCSIDIGETGHVEFQLLHGLAHEPSAGREVFISAHALEAFSRMYAYKSLDDAKAYGDPIRFVESAVPPPPAVPRSVGFELLVQLADCYFNHRGEGLLELMRRVDRYVSGDALDAPAQPSCARCGGEGCEDIGDELSGSQLINCPDCNGTGKSAPAQPPGACSRDHETLQKDWKHSFCYECGVALTKGFGNGNV